MIGKMVSPFYWSLVMALSISSSDQSFRPAGVILGSVTSPGTNSALVNANAAPPPSVPGTIGMEKWPVSRILWQSIHTVTWLARYSPLATSWVRNHRNLLWLFRLSFLYRRKNKGSRCHDGKRCQCNTLFHCWFGFGTEKVKNIGKLPKLSSVHNPG